MSDPFLSEIKIFSFDFAPKGWALCNGQLMLIAQNQALFSVVGTMYGGNGQTTFGLPNLQGRTPIHVDGNHAEGSAGGEATHTLSSKEMPTHIHGLVAATNPDSSKNVNNPTNAYLANSAPAEIYNSNAGSPLVALNPTSVANYGGSQGHENMQPYLTLNFCIALQGVFPSRN